MALKNVETKTMLNLNEIGKLEFESVTTSGALFDFTSSDDRTLIVFHNEGSATTATIKAGNGIQGVADLVLDVGGNGYSAIRVDSGAFKFVKGENKGKIAITPKATVKVCVVALP